MIFNLKWKNKKQVVSNIFGDQVLVDSVAKKLKIDKNDKINVERLLSLTELEVHSTESDVVNLSEIEKLPNLEKVSLFNVNIANLTPLINLKKLHSLEIKKCNISSWKQMNCLTELKKLEMQENNAFYILALSNLMNLEYVNIINNQVEGSNTAIKLNNLKHLTLKKTKIYNIDFLTELKNLTHLNISENEIENIDALIKLKNIMSIDITKNKITCIDPKFNKNTIIGFNFSDENHTIIHSSKFHSKSNQFNTFIEKENNLGTIDNIKTVIPKSTTENAMVSSIEQIFPDKTLATNVANNLNLKVQDSVNNKQLASIKSLDASKAFENIADLSGIEKLVNLKEINIYNLSSDCISKLCNLKHLESLQIVNSKIKFTNEISKLSNLKYLCLRNTGIEKIDFLIGLDNLKHLVVSKNNLTDIDLLIHLPNLKTIDVTDNMITSIDKILSMKHVETFKFSSQNVKKTKLLYALIELRSSKTSSKEKLSIIENVLFNNKWTPKQIFEDDVLAKVIAFSFYGKVGKENLPVRLSKLSEMTHLDGSDFNEKITSLEGIKFFPKLKEVSLRLVETNNFSPIINIKNLESLKIVDSKIQTLNFIGLNSKLQKLDLTNSYIKCILCLENNKELKTLNLQNCKIPKIEEVASLTKLNYLDLSKNNVEDLNKLLKDGINLNHIKKLNIKDHVFISLIDSINNESIQLNKLFPDETFCKLVSDSCNYNGKDDLALELSKISILDFTKPERKVENFDGIWFLKNLKEIKLDNPEDIENGMLKTINPITKIHLPNVNISNINFLKKIPTLSTIMVETNTIIDLNWYLALPNLQHLVLNNGIENTNAWKLCQELSDEKSKKSSNKLKIIRDLISSVTIPVTEIFPDIEFAKIVSYSIHGIDGRENVKIAFSELKNIVCLNSNNFDSQITSLHGIEHLENLREINLKRVNVRVIDNFSNLKNLTTLKITDSKIQTISIAETLTKLENVTLTNCFLEKILNIESQNNLKYLDLSKNKFKSIKELKYLKNLTYLNIMDNDINSISAINYMSVLEELYITGNEYINIFDMLSASKLKIVKFKESSVTKTNIIDVLNQIFIGKICANESLINSLLESFFREKWKTKYLFPDTTFAECVLESVSSKVFVSGFELLSIKRLYINTKKHKDTLLSGIWALRNLEVIVLEDGKVLNFEQSEGSDKKIGMVVDYSMQESPFFNKKITVMSVSTECPTLNVNVESYTGFHGWINNLGVGTFEPVTNSETLCLMEERPNGHKNIDIYNRIKEENLNNNNNENLTIDQIPYEIIDSISIKLENTNDNLRTFNNNNYFTEVSTSLDNIVIQVNPSQSEQERLTWIIERLQDSDVFKGGQGVIYCLRPSDCDLVARTLSRLGVLNSIAHGKLQDNVVTQNISLFCKNEVKILVTTKQSLKSYKLTNIEFVIHYQTPQTLEIYKKQIESVNNSESKLHAILLHGPEDEEILDYFINDLGWLTHDNLKQVKKFISSKECFNMHLKEDMGSKHSGSCCLCTNCQLSYMVPIEISRQAFDFVVLISHNPCNIAPRIEWSDGENIPWGKRYSYGWCFSSFYDSLIGRKIRFEKYTEEKFSVELATESALFLQDKKLQAGIDLIIPVPSHGKPHLVPEFAWNLSRFLEVDFENVLTKTKTNVKQKDQMTSKEQQMNVYNTVFINDSPKIKGKTILLVDDMVDSKWSFTVIAFKLLEAGAKEVYPFALLNSKHKE